MSVLVRLCLSLDVVLLLLLSDTPPATSSSHQVPLSATTPTTFVGWGDSICGQADAWPDARGVLAISAGEANNLALKRDGTVIAGGLIALARRRFLRG